MKPPQRRSAALSIRKGRRVSTAHVESTVNQLINWRFCEKQQMSWTSNLRKSHVSDIPTRPFGYVRTVRWENDLGGDVS
jgi:hypothetical protein